jgi:hypothetical protein
MEERRTIRTGLPPPLVGELDGLVGVVLPTASARLRVERVLGRGTLFVTFAATRIADEGARPVALKVLRPSLSRAASAQRLAPLLSPDRDALVRISRHALLPMARHVRLLDEGVFAAGSVSALDDDDAPWLAFERVSATSLFARVRGAMSTHGVALDPQAARAILGDLSRALDELHRAGVVHRGLHPHQVMVPDGAPRARLVDALVARPEGLPAAFGLHGAHDEGAIAPYLAPEQLEGDWRSAPALDVHAFARVVRFALVGRAPTRSLDADLADASALHPELARGAKLDALRDALAWGEHVDPSRRPPTAGALWAHVRDTIGPGTRTTTIARPSASAVEPSRTTPWVWSVRHRATGGLPIARGALDEDGGGLALADGGLLAFDGAALRHVADARASDVRGVCALGASRFAAFGAHGLVATFDALGTRVVAGDAASSTIDVTAVAEDGARLLVLARTPSGPCLYVRDEGAWRAPLPIDGAAHVAGLARLDALGWVLVGASRTGEGFLATYDDRAHVVRAQPPVGRVALGAVSADGLGLAVAVGAHGLAASISRFAESPARLRVTVDDVETSRSLSAVLVDAAGDAWAACDGFVLRRVPRAPRPSWTPIWHDPDVTAPIRALARAGSSLLVLVGDGTVLEGHPLG